MATISENLQTIVDSTSAIKQAIIDKGGTIEGDISTWASAISEISGGGNSSEEEYVFTGTLSYNTGDAEVTITGNFNKVPDTGVNYMVALGRSVTLRYTDCYISSTYTGPYTLTINFGEMMGYPIPAICILNTVGYESTLIPVKFTQQSGGSNT